ncbi:sigma-70 family RNA polymerase sigma factor [Actinomadura citrea]|uniref:RNA polymerase sigma factor n=1 Tax=Actinomadura citrea TaxID=46158 RepID=A0A7Y9G603_9ACTN|nr:sigma-70 family RNA polymerase sigma factor [Actinomadura citrea]NYE10511.1 RNA polymerase sigma-70 factor (ECF subfamily) [Actinomadura citrea]GGT75777.1 RNA polymerase sigma factor [Actinomadura citrea]
MKTDERDAGPEEFGRMTDPFRRELLAYCYRMLGSVHDAEDLVQEVYLRAWRSYATFDGRASLRTWLYRIATNACLNALEHSSRRVLPSGLASPTDDVPPPGSRVPEVPWLGPLPDRLVGGVPEDPATVVAERAGLRLALIAALQYLPARQRAVLVLRDVLGWPAAEVAGMLGMTGAGVNSTLLRARSRLERLVPASDEITEPDEPGRRELLDRFARAFETVDIPALTRLLTEQAAWEMPPVPHWFSGREAIGRLLAARLPSGRDPNLLVPVHANGQPAFGAYLRGDDGVLRAHSIMVITPTHSGIAHISSFMDPSLFDDFDLPRVHV